MTLDHFYGIEIEEWPARIAETAMLLVDHLANQQMAVEFGFAPDRLPIKLAPAIHRRQCAQKLDLGRFYQPALTSSSSATHHSRVTKEDKEQGKVCAKRGGGATLATSTTLLRGTPRP